MANLGRLQDVQASSATLEGETKTADFRSDWVNLGKCSYFGLYLDISNVTITTLDVSVEVTFDGGTNFTEYTVLESATTAALKQMSAADNAFEAWRNTLPFEDDANIKVRAFFDVNGTTYDIDKAKWIAY